MTYTGQIALPKHDPAHEIVVNYIYKELRLLSAEMQRVAVLLDAAGYQNKYLELSEAGDLAADWADGLVADVQGNLPFHNMGRLHKLMTEQEIARSNQAARNAVAVIEDTYSMEIAEPDAWQAIRKGLGMTKERALETNNE